MKIALASPPFPKSVSHGLSWIWKLAAEAAEQKAEIICFPESYIPGYPGIGYDVEKCTAEKLESALETVRRIAAEYSIGIILSLIHI